MASKLAWRSLQSTAKRRILLPQQYQCFSCSVRACQQQSTSGHRTQQPVGETTEFGYETIAKAEKEARVGAVFSSVAASYDKMNDFMSLGIHRLWKDYFIRSLNPGSPFKPGKPHTEQGWNILDVAGGTGDIAFGMLNHATNVNHDRHTKVTIADINADMLKEGQRRSLSTPWHGTGRLSFMEGNAEHMPSIPNNSVDLYTVAFGIRNFTDKQQALYEAFRILKPGGVFACLEFSKVKNSVLNEGYRLWSFGAIPLIGQVVAGDRDSYQYLVESIDRFPSQEDFRGMIQKAGFLTPGDGYENLSFGIAAIHKGVKPLQGVKQA
ncbi:2-hexaprenyl-6-methoxy-1,4-benzoquinone methyltransferase [Ascosphaera aggregata]|nr:2-hexaprenyl-6-methoxy-1,4-benzoquinone methyltransferase [Ascosphaera aggregata]